MAEPLYPKRRLVAALFSFEPTERAVWALVGIAVLGLLGAALETLGGAALAAFLGLALGIVADAWLAGSPRTLLVERCGPDVWIQGVPTRIVRKIESRHRARLLLVDALPAAASEDGRGRELIDVVEVGENERVRVPAEVVLYRRGVHRFGRITVRTEGPLGLVRRRMRHEVPTTARVLPDLARIGARAERLLRGQDEGGARKKRAPKEGREFESLRGYQRGDDIRLIEWKASAKRGELVVRRLMPQTRQDVVVLLDTGRQLAGRHDAQDGGEPRLDVALAAALTLAAAALSKKDRVGFGAFAGEVRAFVPPGEGRGHLRRIAEAVNEHDALPEEADYGSAVRFLLARQKRRAMVVIVTDVLDEPSARALAAAVARLRGRHLPVVLAVGDPALHRLVREEATEGEEPTTRAVSLAASRLLAHRRAALAALTAAGAVVVDAPAPRAAALAVQAYVGMKATGKL